MSDLISRSELLKEIEKYKFGAISNDAEREYIKNTILDFIIGQPTAYSVDGVVEELEERKALHERLVEYENKNGTVTEKYQHIKAIDVLSDAIEIIKHGGVSDDVCEWKLDGDMAINPHTFIKYKIKQYDSLYALDTCQYCGKKIKVVD